MEAQENKKRDVILRLSFYLVRTEIGFPKVRIPVYQYGFQGFLFFSSNNLALEQQPRWEKKEFVEKTIFFKEKT